MGLFAKDSKDLKAIVGHGLPLTLTLACALFLSACDNSEGTRKQQIGNPNLVQQGPDKQASDSGKDKANSVKTSNQKMAKLGAGSGNSASDSGSDKDRESILTTENFCANPIDTSEAMKVQISEMRPHVMILIGQDIYCRFDKSLNEKTGKQKLVNYKTILVRLARAVAEQGDRAPESIGALREWKAEFELLEQFLADTISKREELSECSREITYVTSAIDMFLNRNIKAESTSKEKIPEAVRKSNERVYKLLLRASDATISARSFAPEDAKSQFSGAIREGSLATLRLQRLGANNKVFLATLKKFLADVQANREAYKALQQAGGQPGADVQQLLNICSELQAELDRIVASQDSANASGSAATDAKKGASKDDSKLQQPPNQLETKPNQIQSVPALGNSASRL